MHEKDFKILVLQARLKVAYIHLHALTTDEDLHDARCNRQEKWDSSVNTHVPETECDCINRDIKDAREFININTNDINQLTIPTYDI